MHRIVILGAGYAGAAAAGHLARHLDPDDVEITVVNAESEFVERMRLHQVAAGQDVRGRPLTELFAGTGIRLRVARVTAVDAERRTVTVADGELVDRIDYDTLLYTLGSAAEASVPGVEEYALNVAGRPDALRLRRHLDALAEHGTVLVVGGNLTAIETATEIAESRPGLRVSLVTTDELGGWLGARARRHLLDAFDGFGIEVHENTTIEAVRATEAVAADGTVFFSDAIVWAAGFAVDPIAAASGLAVEDDGRITIDEATMRSVSHPTVYAAGDSAYVIGGNGRPLPMSCATAGFTGMRATAAIMAELTGHGGPRTPLAYVGNCISLGQRDAIFQVVDGDARSRSWSVRGRVAARFKAFVLRGTAWNIGHPTYGLPTRRRRLATAADRSDRKTSDDVLV